ncbi:unnamed protein product, partial [marine sediment metagenome]
FGLMAEEMQAKLRKVYTNTNLDIYLDGGWVRCGSCDFNDDSVYRLRPDYEAKSDTVECEIKDSATGLQVRYDTEIWPISKVCESSDFVGFKYEGDDIAYPEARKYKDEKGYYHPSWKEGYEVLTPTHVLFRKAD